jgi:hypothetical protein
MNLYRISQLLKPVLTLNRRADRPSNPSITTIIIVVIEILET